MTLGSNLTVTGPLFLAQRFSCARRRCAARRARAGDTSTLLVFVPVFLLMVRSYRNERSPRRVVVLRGLLEVLAQTSTALLGSAASPSQDDRTTMRAWLCIAKWAPTDSTQSRPLPVAPGPSTLRKRRQAGGATPDRRKSAGSSTRLVYSVVTVYGFP